MLTPRERRYLTLYLPLGIIAAVLVDAAAFAEVGSSTGFGSGGLCHGCSDFTPIGTALALGQPIEEVAGANHWYNFTVQSAGSGILTGNVQFQPVTAMGAIITAGHGWTLDVLGPTGLDVASYSFSSASFSAGPATVLQSGQVFALNTGSTTLSGQGDILNVIGTGSFQGSISVNIP